MEDDSDNLQGGDLGLGRGLKPGGIACVVADLDSSDVEGNEATHDRKPTDELRPSFDHAYIICSNCQNTSLYIIKCSRCRQLSAQENSSQQTKMRIYPKTVQTPKHLIRSKTKSENLTQEEIDRPVGIIGDIPLGTSIRQQKKLYEQNRKELFEQNPDFTESSSKHPMNNSGNEEKSLGSKEESESASLLAKKLIAAERTNEILRCELETCKKVSESRYKAMRLFKGHSYAIQSQQIDSVKKTNQMNKCLQAEINQLQFELEYREAATLTSQEMWTERFRKVSQENEELKVSLNEQTKLVRNLQAEKTALIREQDELLALLDVQERQRYEASRSQCSEDNSDYNNFTSTELAILGACRCRIHNPQPCGCAHAAAYTKREVARQRAELTVERQRAEDAVIMADAYRIAFEEQLNRNSGLMRRLVEMTSVTYGETQSHVSKPRAALRWIVKQLNEEDYIPMTMREGQMERNSFEMKGRTRRHQPEMQVPGRSPQQVSPVPNGVRALERHQATDLVEEHKTQTRKGSTPDSGKSDGSVSETCERLVFSDAVKDDDMPQVSDMGLTENVNNGSRQNMEDVCNEGHLTSRQSGGSSEDGQSISKQNNSPSEDGQIRSGQNSGLSEEGYSRSRSMENSSPTEDGQSRSRLSGGPSEDGPIWSGESGGQSEDGQSRSGQSADVPSEDWQSWSTQEDVSICEGMEGAKSNQFQILLDAVQTKTDSELISMLLELVNDRTEALAHQRLAARMLAKRLTDVERKLADFTENVYDK